MEKRKIIYYQDEKTDEFSTAMITPRLIDDTYAYEYHTWLRKVAHIFLYRVCARFLGFFYLKIVYGHRIKNRKVLKGQKGKGFFVYGNHTNAGADACIPSMVSFPTDTYVIVHPNNVSMPVFGKITPFLGALPLPDTFGATKHFIHAIQGVIAKSACVMIYPEAHIWPYYTGIRSFSDASFRYPVQCQVPVFAMTNTYQKRLFWPLPRMVTYLDGPFYPDVTKSVKEQKSLLRDQVYGAMVERSKYNTVERIRYIKMGK